MRLASPADVEAALGRSLTEAETAQVDFLLDEASDAVTGYIGEEVGQPTPGPVVRVAARMVARVLRIGVDTLDDVSQEGRTMGPFSEQRTYTPGSRSGSPWLDAADKIKLRPFRAGMVSVPLSSEHTGRYRGVW